MTALNILPVLSGSARTDHEILSKIMKLPIQPDFQ